MKDINITNRSTFDHVRRADGTSALIFNGEDVAPHNPAGWTTYQIIQIVFVLGALRSSAEYTGGCCHITKDADIKATAGMLEIRGCVWVKYGDKSIASRAAEVLKVLQQMLTDD